MLYGKKRHISKRFTEENGMSASLLREKIYNKSHRPVISRRTGLRLYLSGSQIRHKLFFAVSVKFSVICYDVAVIVRVTDSDSAV